MARRRLLLPRQRGAALLIFLIFLTMGTAAWLVNSFDAATIDARRQQQTELALRKARDAIIGYMLKYRDEQNSHGQAGRMYGYLPMPDLGTSRNGNIGCRTNSSDATTEQEGCEANISDDPLPTLVGRLPWRTLGIEPLRDGHGECLWLIVAAPHLAGNSWRSGTLEMNWDTLGQFDILSAQGSTELDNRVKQVHDRPVAIIFAPGPRLPNQNRGALNVSDDVSQCGGNYDARNYLDPWNLEDLSTLTNYFDPNGATPNHASGAIGNLERNDDPDTAKSLTIQGSIAKDGSNYIAGGCKSKDCISNDLGLPITNAMIHASLRNHSYFRSDLNDLLFATGSCLEPAVAFTPITTTGPADPNRYGKIPAAANCQDRPIGYFTHYKEQLLAARVADINTCRTDRDTPGNCFDVALYDTPLAPPENKKCHGVVLLGGERLEKTVGGVRIIEQPRVTDTNRQAIANYLEAPNSTSFTGSGTSFIGATRFEKPRPGRVASQDVIRCIPGAGYSDDNPDGESMLAVQNTTLGGTAQQLARFDATTNILTLGQEYASSPGSAGERYGCAWESETHWLGGGLRRYFKFRINDTGLVPTPFDGFAFALVDADRNGQGACGAAQQHLGYSGNNGDTPFLAAPKIGIEFDTRRNYRAHASFSDPTGFYPAFSNKLNNGRADPNYTGGHVGIVYWGGETVIGTLAAEEDDNVHGRGGPALTCPHTEQISPPTNPVANGTPLAGTGVYKLDPNLSSVPVNLDFHVRVEVTRTAPANIVLPAVRVAAPANINIDSPGASIDGITLHYRDRVLLWNQSLSSQNGVYLWQAADQPMTRASDYDNSVELAGAIIEVAEGATYAMTTWRQSNASATLNISALQWSQVPVKLAADDLAAATTQGFPLRSGDRVLIKAGASQGIKVWNGVSLTTPDDASSPSAGMAVRVGMGTHANSWWRFDGTAWSVVPTARFAVQGNVALNVVPMDGCLQAAPNDYVLLKNQSAGKENGLYQWNGSALIRAAAADAASELAGMIVQVSEGTDMGRAFRQSTMAHNGTMEADSIQWGALDPVFSSAYTVEAWILKDSVTDALRIAAMKDTSRPMQMLDSSFTAHIKDTPTIPHPFRRARVGMTIGQRNASNDQTATVQDRFTTWLD